MADTTSLTLLDRLRSPDDQEAWARFTRIYTPLLYSWCRRAGLQEQDAADVVQDVFVQLVRKLPAFLYDRQGSFRNWLRTVTLNKWRERQRRRAPVTTSGNELERLAARDEDWQFSETEYRHELVRCTLPVIEPEFSPAMWQAFCSHVIEGEEAGAVARRLGIRIGTVYAAKCRILGRLRQELTGLLDEEAPGRGRRQ